MNFTFLRTYITVVTPILWLPINCVSHLPFFTPLDLQRGNNIINRNDYYDKFSDVVVNPVLSNDELLKYFLMVL